MAVVDYFKKNIRPLSVSNITPNSTMGFKKDNPLGGAIAEYVANKKSKANEIYISQRNKSTSEVAQQVVDKSAGNVVKNEIGIPSGKGTDLTGQFRRQLDTIGQTGQTALLASMERARHQELQRLQDRSAGLVINWTPGASANNPGAKAVSLALQAYQNKTPYVWGGNSLSQGVDCSGLVQQVYSQLGIKLPRTTYEQAKNGKQVSLSNLLPGDLVFYNTGSRDPNGIGRNSHVAIFIGNGQVVHAVNSREGIKTTNINYTGSPSMGLRPW